MKAGVLIIGSLFWDKKAHREKWRNRLNMNEKKRVEVPIGYGRIATSRGNTYTMTFRDDGKMGKAIFIPFSPEIKTRSDLIEQALAMWDAEQSEKRKTNTIGSSWGVVGALFKNEYELSKEWTDYFQTEIEKNYTDLESMRYVDEHGFLRIPWPKVVEESKPIDADIILATVTKPTSKTIPNAIQIAKAWIEQSKGYEKYFFNNIKSNIQTAEDLDIWKAIKQHNPEWLKKSEYSSAIEILEKELDKEV